MLVGPMGRLVYLSRSESIFWEVSRFFCRSMFDPIWLWGTGSPQNWTELH